MVFRTPYKNPPNPVSVTFKLPSMAQQHFREECDVNRIMERYAKTGILPQQQGAVFADVSEYGDYQFYLHKMREIDDAFMTLPAKTRARFGNSPEALVEFLQDPRNLDEASQLGLVQRPQTGNVSSTAAPEAAASPPPVKEAQASESAAGK